MLPQGRMLRLFEMIRILRIRPYSVPELSEALDMSVRTVYRYIKIIEASGVCIDATWKRHQTPKLDQAKYFIFGKCPCCGKEC